MSVKQFLYPSVWRAIHVTAIMLDVKDKKSRIGFINFMRSLQILLPDEDSRLTLRMFMREYKLTDEQFSSREKLFEWTFDLHDYTNEVLETIGYNVDRITFNEAKSMYNVKNLTKQSWGPAFWRMIHGLASKHNPERKNKIAFRVLMTSLTLILPCPFCRKHLTENLKKLKIDNHLVSRKKLFFYTYSLHNLVNSQLNKPPFPEIEAYKMYGMLEEISR